MLVVPVSHNSSSRQIEYTLQVNESVSYQWVKRKLLVPTALKMGYVSSPKDKFIISAQEKLNLFRVILQEQITNLPTRPESVEQDSCLFPNLKPAFEGMVIEGAINCTNPTSAHEESLQKNIAPSCHYHFTLHLWTDSCIICWSGARIIVAIAVDGFSILSSK